ncbi:MAG: MBL fold metallo-hydrolase [Candidatus Humimicrobiaceae bacterium]
MKISNNIHMIGSGSFGLSCSFDGNFYLINFKDELVMIDTGSGVDIDIILNNIKQDGLDPAKISKILLTHSHVDHAGGAYNYKKRYNCPIYMSEQEAGFLEHGGEKELALDIAKKSGLYSKDYQLVNCGVDKKLKNGDIIKVGGFEINAINVPGHSKGSICYFVNLPEGNALFSGDVIFADGLIEVLNCDGSELSDYRKYISRLSNLNIDMLFPGHSLFVLSEGQKHIDKAVNSLSLLFTPKNFA